MPARHTRKPALASVGSPDLVRGARRRGRARAAVGGRRIAAGAAAALVLALAGCGGGDDPGPADATRAATTTQQAAPPVETRAAATTAATPPPTDPVPTTTAGQPEPSSNLSDAEALGQMVVARFTGATPSSALLGRIERGEVGGVILFKDNVTGGTARVKRLVRRLQAAARRGDRPPLLIAIDQEGGEIRRLPGPPFADAANMGSASAVRRQGRLTARALKRVGVNLDLAPLADVSSGSSSFLGDRAFGTSPSRVASRACAFADGLRDGGVGATLKHFPGLGRATTNTDFDRTRIPGSLSTIRRDYAAYERCGKVSTTIVMMSSAIYPDALGPDPAVITPAAYRRELRRATGGDPLTISDDLETPAVQAHSRPSRRAIDAGLDLLLYARTEQASAQAYAVLVKDVAAGRIDDARVQDAARRIVALKRRIAE
jgi:beta-N-acetylhexosaminidase